MSIKRNSDDSKSCNTSSNIENRKDINSRHHRHHLHLILYPLTSEPPTNPSHTIHSLLAGEPQISSQTGYQFINHGEIIKNRSKMLEKFINKQYPMKKWIVKMACC